jgi:hypothetical protein
MKTQSRNKRDSDRIIALRDASGFVRPVSGLGRDILGRYRRHPFFTFPLAQWSLKNFRALPLRGQRRIYTGFPFHPL